MKRKSPLRLPNGKFREKDYVLSMIPKGIKEYRDVRMGAGHVSMEIINSPSLGIEKIWLNDENPDTVSFFQHASYYNKDVVAKVRELVEKRQRKELFDYCKQALAREKQKAIDRDDILCAAAFFIINRLSFAGTLIGGYCNDNWMDGKTPRLNIHALKRLETMSGLIRSGVLLTNIDYSVPLSASSKYKDDEVFIFVNPPFYNSSMQMYNKSESDGNLFDYKTLADDLCVSPYKWLMVIDDTKYIRDLFSFANIIPKRVMTGQSGAYLNKVKHREILYISNY